MKPAKRVPIVAASLLLTVSAGAWASGPTAADIVAVRDYVARNHYAPAAREEALRDVATLPGLTGDAARFELQVAHIAALADNGHSVLLPTQWVMRYPRSLVHFGLFSDGLYVVAAPQALAGTLRRRVIAINDHPWQQLRQAYSTFQGGNQAFRDQFVTLFMELPALLAAAGFGSRRDRLELTLEAPDGRREMVAVPALPGSLQGPDAFLGYDPLLDGAPMLSARPLYLQQPDTNLRLVFPRELDGAYIQLNVIGGPGFESFLAETLATLRARHPRNIVVDLRFNLGGDLTLARNFMEALPGVSEGARLYAITSGRTFSAAISSLGYLKQAAGPRLAIVGEPIGDRLEFWTEGRTPVQLPGLGAFMLYATERHNYITGCPEPDCHAPIRNRPIRVRSLQPDIPTPLSFADYLAGRDPAMEAILADTRQHGTRRQ